MKNVILVTKQGNALAIGECIEGNIAKTATGTFLPCLEVLKEVLNTIPKEIGETVNIYIPDTIQGLTSGVAVEYIKTGKTLTGNKLSDEEVNMFKEIYELYAERIFNVRFSVLRYLKKTDTALQQMKAKAYNLLDSYIAGNGGTAINNTVVVDPDKALREALDNAITKALEEGDLDKYDKLMERRNALKAPEVTSANKGTSAGPIVFEEKKEETIEDEIENMQFENEEQVSDIPSFE